MSETDERETLATNKGTQHNGKQTSMDNNTSTFEQAYLKNTNGRGGDRCGGRGKGKIEERDAAFRVHHGHACSDDFVHTHSATHSGFTFLWAWACGRRWIAFSCLTKEPAPAASKSKLRVKKLEIGELWTNGAAHIHNARASALCLCITSCERLARSALGMSELLRRVRVPPCWWRREEQV